MTVGELARAVTDASGIRCTPRMIRNYESRGLIPPPRRSQGGTRIYPEGYVDKVARIKRLQRDFDLSLSAIKHVLAHPDLGVPLPERDPSVATGSHRPKRATAGTVSRREDLLQSADSVLRRKGYRETTIDDIVREAGVAKGTFYLYFSGKQQLFLEVLERAVQSLEERLGQELHGVDGPVERLEKRALSYMKGYLQYRDLIHILYGESVGGNSTFQEVFREIYRKITSALVDDLRGIASNIGRSDLDPELLAYALVGAGEMLAYRSTLDDRYQLEEIVSSSMLLARGMQA